MLHASTGGFAFGPRGLPHAFQNIGETAGRLLVITTPSGLERFFDQYAELLPGPVDQPTLEAIAVANWSKFVGPPRSEEHTSELQSPVHLVCRLLLEKKKNISSFSILALSGTYERTV